MARLSGWKRIGIIASVLWIPVAGIITYKAVDNYLWNTVGAAASAACSVAAKNLRDEAEGKQPISLSPDPLGEICISRMNEFLAKYGRVPLQASVLVAFTSVPLGWGLAYLIRFLVNWVKRGFTSPGNSN
jgi:hypothetical protein